jgi:hypothetical protein
MISWPFITASSSCFAVIATSPITVSLELVGVHDELLQPSLASS